MKRFKIHPIFVILIILLALALAVRTALGRDRPDLAAWASVDDGLWSFTKSYETGSVGPFVIGESREQTAEKLGDYRLFDQDRDQLTQDVSQWRISLPAKSGGYITYTIEFDRGRIIKISPYYSVFAGL